MNVELSNTGLLVSVIGMVVVFLFLILMVWVMEVNAKLVVVLNKFFPEVVPETTSTTKKKVTASNEDESVAVAIAAIMASK